MASFSCFKSGQRWEELDELTEEVAGGGRRCSLPSACCSHLDVVDGLMDWHGMSVVAGGSVHFHHLTIESAPLLWATQAINHLDVVQCLLRHGASVNRTTCTSSMLPACLDGHLEVVR